MMFCMNCGTKLPDNARFCYNCGAKIPEGLGQEGTAVPESPEPSGPDLPQSAAPVDAAAPEETPATAENPLPEAAQQETLPEVPCSHFTVLGKYQVELPRATALYNQLWAPFNREGLRAADRAQDELEAHLKEHAVDNPVEFSSRLLKYCMVSCNPFFEKAVDLLLEYGIDYVTKEDLRNKLADKMKKTDLVQAMQEDQEAIEAYQHELSVEAQANKANWQGGGFGITGAVKGAIKAQMLNTAQDALSSLGRSITGNSYSARLQRFIENRISQRDYPEMAWDFISGICRYDLFALIHRMLVDQGSIPATHFETHKADSRRKNLLERFAGGKITQEEMMEGFCRCLEITGDSLPVYEQMLLLDPEAAKDVFQMAAAEGYELSLARRIRDEYIDEREVVKHFQFPDWMPKNLHRVMYPVSGPAMLEAMLILLREEPEQFEKKDDGRTDIALIGVPENYWVPSWTEQVDFWGMEKSCVVLELEQPEKTDWACQGVHFHLVDFDGEAGEWAEKKQAEKLQEAKKALGAGKKEEALAAFDVARELGSGEAAYQAGLLYQEQEQEEAAEWAFVEAAVLEEKEAAWQVYQMLKETDPEQGRVFLKMAAEAVRYLEISEKYTEAIAWYRKLAEEKEGTACLRLGWMASQGEGMEKDAGKAVEWYEKAVAYGCEDARKNLGELAFSLGQQAEEKAGSESGEQAALDREQALTYYRKAQAQEQDGAMEKVRDLALTLGKEKEEQGRDREALAFYEEAADQGSMEACLQAAWICMDPQKETYDFGQAWSWYQKADAKAHEKGEEQEAIEEEWNRRKAQVPLTDRVACLTELMDDDGYYYVGNRLSGPLDNAMQAYGSSGGVQREQVVLLCDATHSLLWGKGEQGFLITRDGQLISSQGIRVSLDQMGPVKHENNEIKEAASGTVLAKFKNMDLADCYFCDRLNEIVLLPLPEKQEPETSSVQTASPGESVGSSGPTEPGKFAASAGTAQPADPVGPTETSEQAQPEPASGAKLICPRCGAVGKPGTRFCGQCGSPLEPQASPEGRAGEIQEQKTAGKDRREAILAFCREFQEKISAPFYFRCLPDIPEKKLRNAMASYGTQGGIRPEDVLVLCDTTLFGSAKEGFLLTADRLVSNAGSFALEECGEIIPAKGMTDSKVILMPQHVVIADMPPSDEQTLFIQWFNGMVKK